MQNKLIQKIKIRPRTVSIYIVLFGVSFFVSYFEIFDFSKVKSVLVNKKYTPILAKEDLYEINFIYIGSSKCGFSNNDEIFNAVDVSLKKIQDKADSLNIGFNSLGVSAEWDIDSGLNHLNKVANFNEITMGNSWANNSIIKYVGEMNNEASTPQILLTFRKYGKEKIYNIDSEVLIMRIVGKDQIMNWVKNNNELPDFFDQKIPAL